MALKEKQEAEMEKMRKRHLAAENESFSWKVYEETMDQALADCERKGMGWKEKIAALKPFSYSMVCKGLCGGEDVMTAGEKFVAPFLAWFLTVSYCIIKPPKE